MGKHLTQNPNPWLRKKRGADKSRGGHNYFKSNSPSDVKYHAISNPLTPLYTSERGTTCDRYGRKLLLRNTVCVEKICAFETVREATKGEAMNNICKKKDNKKLSVDYVHWFSAQVCLYVLRHRVHQPLSSFHPLPPHVRSQHHV